MISNLCFYNYLSAWALHYIQANQLVVSLNTKITHSYLQTLAYKSFPHAMFTSSFVQICPTF